MKKVVDKEERNWVGQFNDSRTNFWLSLLWMMIESFIPGIIIWVFLGYDFINEDYLPNPKAGWLTLVCLGYLTYTLIATTVVFLLKGHKADNFTFSFVMSSVLISLILNGAWLGNNTLYIFIKFLFIIVVISISSVFGVFITVNVRNLELKHEEYKIEVVEAFNRGEQIPSKKMYIIKKNNEYLEKKKKREMVLKKFQDKLNKNTDSEKDLNNQDKNKLIKLNTKLDSKEAKKIAKLKSKGKW